MIYYNLDCCNILTDESLLHLSNQSVSTTTKEEEKRSKQKQLQFWYTKSKSILIYSSGYILISLSSFVIYKMYQYFKQI